MQVFVGACDTEAQAVAALCEVFKASLQTVAVAAGGFAAVVFAVEDIALPLAVLDTDREIARTEGCTRREQPCRFDAAESSDIVEGGFERFPFDGCAFSQGMRHAFELSIADGGTVFDVDLAVASGENADCQRAVAVRLRRQVGGCRRIAVTACIVGEFCEKRVDIGFGERAAKVRRRPLVEGGSGELRAVLLDVDAREVKGCRRTAAACGRQVAFKRVFLRFFGQMRIGLRQTRRSEGAARQEKRRRKGQRKYDLRAFCFDLQRKDSFLQRFKKRSTVCASKMQPLNFEVAFRIEAVESERQGADETRCTIEVDSVAKS